MDTEAAMVECYYLLEAINCYSKSGEIIPHLLVMPGPEISLWGVPAAYNELHRQDRFCWTNWVSADRGMKKLLARLEIGAEPDIQHSPPGEPALGVLSNHEGE